MDDSGFNLLTFEQKQAVTAEGDIVLIRAGVGSGKTRVLLQRIIYLIEEKGVEAHRMAILTFTNRAAREIRQRLENLRRPWLADLQYMGTFHSVANTLLRERVQLKRWNLTSDYEIIDPSEGLSILKEIIDEESLKIRRKRRLLNRWRKWQKGSQKRGGKDDFPALMEAYQKFKRDNDLVDFDDLLSYWQKALEVEEMDFDWILVDELQDTDLRQKEILFQLHRQGASIFAVGDPQQSIYSWRGSDPEIFEDFSKLPGAREFGLTINFRATSTLLEGYRTLLPDQNLKSHRHQGRPIHLRKHQNSLSEAMSLAARMEEIQEEGVPLEEVAILYRQHLQGEKVAEVFDREGIDYFWKRPKKGEWDGEKGEIDRPGVGEVQLMSLHSAKGLEFSHVFIIGANHGNIPLLNRDEEGEERRLFFVGASRAKNYLEISYLQQPELPRAFRKPSPYLKMLAEEAVQWIEGGEATLEGLVEEVKDQGREEKKEPKVALHPHYGEGEVIEETDTSVKVRFEGYGEKRFMKGISPIEFKD